MGKRGQKPTPTAILEQRGSWRAKIRENEPVADGNLEMPDWLCPRAMDVWEYVAPKLEAMNVVGVIDSMMLARYCEIYSQYIDCTDFIQKNGRAYPVKNAKGDVIDMKTFPHVRDAKNYADQLKQIEAQFGMSPAARPDIKALPKRANETKPTAQSEIERLLG